MIWAFMETEWFVPEENNWHIKGDAPEWVKEDFKKYKQQEEEAKQMGIIID